MKKGLAVLSAAVTAVVIGASAWACSDSDPPATFGSGTEDASFDSGGSLIRDGSSSGPDGRVVCNPSLSATFQPEFKPPKAKPEPAPCSEEDLGGYFEACLKKPDERAPCETWLSEHAACATCIEPEDHTGPIQQHMDRFYYTLNIAGCLSIRRSETAEGTCAAAFSDAVQCQRASCDLCLSKEGATFDDFRDCQAKAKETACQRYENDIGRVCGTDYNDPGSIGYPCFQQRNEDREAHIVRVAGFFCGPSAGGN